MALIGAEGAVVSKDALIERVWPGRIVEENNLLIQVSVLRKALTADRDLIRNVAGRGYRFTGEIRTISTGSSVAPAAGAVQKANSHKPRPQTNLPEPVSELIGRDVGNGARFSTLAPLIPRLVSLAGAKASAKTRLAIEAARHLLPRYGDGVWLVELAPAVRSRPRPGHGLGYRWRSGSRSRGTCRQRNASRGALRSKQLMLVLDNCEHVVDAATQMTEALLRASPAARVIATSREPLRAEGEWVGRFRRLLCRREAGSNSHDPLRYGAVRLFVERPRARRNPRFSSDERTLATIVAVCRRLDGIPLAIELAAARAATLGVEEIASWLDRRFDLLTGGGGRRFHSSGHYGRRWIGATTCSRRSIDQILGRLSVFAGGFTSWKQPVRWRHPPEINASGVVDCVANLVEKSLVTTDVGGFEARFPASRDDAGLRAREINRKR